MDGILRIKNEEIDRLLDWKSIVDVVKQVLIALSNKNIENKTDKNVLYCVETARTFTGVPSGDGFLLCMPSYLQGLKLGYDGKRESALSCKLLSVFSKNASLVPPLPSIDGSVMLYDGENGSLKAMLDADSLTLWRTAAVTCAATKILWGSRENRPSQILAILGAGAQGRAHALAFYNQFQFGTIRIWNRTTSKAEALVSELKELGAPAVLCMTNMECVSGADVIVTTTFSPKPLVQDDWVKGDAMINAVGVIRNGSELSPLIYKRAKVYVESKEGASRELPHLTIEGDLGEVETVRISKPRTDLITIFQSLGNGVEDAGVALLLHDLKMKSIASESQKP